MLPRLKMLNYNATQNKVSDHYKRLFFAVMNATFHMNSAGEKTSAKRLHG